MTEQALAPLSQPAGHGELAASEHRSLVAGGHAVVAIEPVDDGRREPVSLAGAVKGIAATMHDAVARMDADDVSLDVDIRDGYARMKFRAYRR